MSAQPVPSTCLYCHEPIEIRLTKKGRLWQVNPGTTETHGCIGRSAVRTHAKDRDVFGTPTDQQKPRRPRHA